MRIKIPYGYRIVNGMAEPDPREHEKLLQLYEHYLEGWSLEMCLSSIGIDRSIRGLRAILDNPVYLGTDYYPPLIDGETWNAAKEAAERRGAHLVGRASRMSRQPIPIRTRFTMAPDAEEPVGDPVECAAAMYARIGIQCDAEKHDAPDDLYGAFLEAGAISGRAKPSRGSAEIAGLRRESQ